MLGLSNNRIGPKGAEAIGEALADKKYLIKLGLESNSIGPEGIIALSQSLTQNESLQELYLYNSMMGGGFLALAQMLGNKKDMRVLGLEANELSEGEGFDVLEIKSAFMTHL